MKRFDDCSEFVQSVVQAFVSLIATSIGLVCAGVYTWLNIWLRQLNLRRNVPALEIFALGCETLLICGAVTLFVAAKLYRRLGATRNESVITDDRLAFAVLARVLAGILLVVILAAEIAPMKDLQFGMIARLTAIFIIFAPLAKRDRVRLCGY